MIANLTQHGTTFFDPRLGIFRHDCFQICHIDIVFTTLRLNGSNGCACRRTFRRNVNGSRSSGRRQIRIEFCILVVNDVTEEAIVVHISSHSIVFTSPIPRGMCWLRNKKELTAENRHMSEN